MAIPSGTEFRILIEAAFPLRSEVKPAALPYDERPEPIAMPTPSCLRPQPLAMEHQTTTMRNRKVIRLLAEARGPFPLPNQAVVPRRDREANWPVLLQELLNT
jgi:hypothetical protein